MTRIEIIGCLTRQETTGDSCGRPHIRKKERRALERRCPRGGNRAGAHRLLMRWKREVYGDGSDWRTDRGYLGMLGRFRAVSGDDWLIDMEEYPLVTKSEDEAERVDPERINKGLEPLTIADRINSGLLCRLRRLAAA